VHSSLSIEICKFNARDIDPVALKERAKEEADQIFKRNKSKRSYQEILAHCMLGHAAEINLLKCGYIDNPEKYMDVKEPDGTTVDVKVITKRGPEYVNKALKNTIERCILSKLQYNFADKVYIYTFDQRTEDYEMIGIYEWNSSKREFLLCTNGQE